MQHKIPFVSDYVSRSAIALDTIGRFMIEIVEPGEDWHELRAYDKQNDDIFWIIYKGTLDDCQNKMKSIISQGE